MPFQVALANLERQMAEHLKRQGERLRQARKALNLSQEGAAQLIGVTSKAYGDWERGKSEPRDRNWQKIEEQLAVAAREVRGEPPQTQLEQIEAKLDKILAEQRLIRLELTRPSRQRRTLPPRAGGKEATGS